MLLTTSTGRAGVVSDASDEKQGSLTLLRLLSPASPTHPPRGSGDAEGVGRVTEVTGNFWQIHTLTSK